MINGERIQQAALIYTDRHATKREKQKDVGKLLEGFTPTERTLFFTMVYIEMNKMQREMREAKQ